MSDPNSKVAVFSTRHLLIFFWVGDEKGKSEDFNAGFDGM